MTNDTEIEHDPQAVILGCHAILDRADISPAHDWRSHITDDISYIRSRLAYRIHLALARSQITGWNFDQIIDRLRELLKQQEEDE